MSQDILDISQFGITLAHSRVGTETADSLTAAEQLTEHGENWEVVRRYELRTAINTVSALVDVTAQSDEGGLLGLEDLFTAEQLLDMQSRIQTYLGKPYEQHVQDPKAPAGYDFFVERLSSYFHGDDDSVTGNFRDFLRLHTDGESGTGPLEINSRRYAQEALERAQLQLVNHFQAPYNFDFTGPRKQQQGSMVWERGVAECQFLIVDAIRDYTIHGSRVASEDLREMTLEDVETNIRAIIESRGTILKGVAELNPVLTEQVESAINAIGEMTVEVFSRGRPDVARFKREPKTARRHIYQLERLLMQAAILREAASERQEDIPVLE